MSAPRAAIARTARRLGTSAVLLLVAATGTAAAHTGDGSGSGTMHGSWGFFGGAMGLWGVLWMGLLLGVVVAVVYALLNRTDEQKDDERSLDVLRERYARGDLNDEEFERRRNRLEGMQ